MAPAAFVCNTSLVNPCCTCDALLLLGPGFLRRNLQDLPPFDLQQLPALASCEPAQLLQLLPPAGQCYAALTDISSEPKQQQQLLDGVLGGTASCDAQLWRAYMVLAFLTHVGAVTQLLCCYPAAAGVGLAYCTSLHLYFK
jgi:hypothetical protein